MERQRFRPIEYGKFDFGPINVEQSMVVEVGCGMVESKDEDDTYCDSIVGDCGDADLG